MTFSERLARVERELLRMKSNQSYSLNQGKIYEFKSDKLQSSLVYGAWSLTFSYRFVPMDKNICIMYPRLAIYNKSGELVPLAQVYLNTYGIGSLSNYVVEDDTLILTCENYTFSTFLSGSTLTEFSAVLEIISTSDGVFQVTQS